MNITNINNIYPFCPAKSVNYTKNQPSFEANKAKVVTGISAAAASAISAQFVASQGLIKKDESETKKIQDEF